MARAVGLAGAGEPEQDMAKAPEVARDGALAPERAGVMARVSALTLAGALALALAWTVERAWDRMEAMGVARASEMGWARDGVQE